MYHNYLGDLGAIAGIGGGGILTIVSIVVSDVVSLQERGKYQGITGVVVAIGNAIGPIIGGLFTGGGSTWRWIFVSLGSLSKFISRETLIWIGVVYQHTSSWSYHVDCAIRSSAQKSGWQYDRETQED